MDKEQSIAGNYSDGNNKWVFIDANCQNDESGGNKTWKMICEKLCESE